MQFDGQAAAARMIAMATAPALSCLETVADAIKGDVLSDNPGFYEMAADAARATPEERRHPYGDGLVAPAGTVGHAVTTTRPDGHIWINLGADIVVSTDTPSRGRVGITTLRELADRMGLLPTFWSDWFVGHDLVNLGNPANPADLNRRPFDPARPLIQKEGKTMLFIRIKTDETKSTVFGKFPPGAVLSLPEAGTPRHLTQDQYDSVVNSIARHNGAQQAQQYYAAQPIPNVEELPAYSADEADVLMATYCNV